MPSGWKDGADERFTKLINEELDETAPFVNAWVLVALYVDDEGATCTAFNSMEGVRRTATLGMLTHALEVERAGIFWEEQPDA